jgi:hypothetical protein
MATALFTPAFNLRTGGGQLLVYPYTATNATAASTKTVAITSTIITAFKLLTDAKLTVTLDGTDYVLSGMNFTSISTVDDIVKVLNAQGLDCNISVVDTNKIQFQSRRYGSTSGASLKATSSGSGTDIYGNAYLNGATQVTTAGTNASGTTIADVLAQIDSIGFTGGILTTQYLDNDAVIAAATAIQATDYIFFESTQSLKNISVLGASIKSAQLTKTRLNAYSYAGAIGAKREIATYASVACSSNYSGNNTVLTMNLKTLNGIEADLNLNQTYYNAAKANGVDIYGSTEGLSCVYAFDNGLFTDEATGQLWFKKALEVSGFNYLRKTNTKIPQTESGMTGLKNAYEQRCQQGIRNGLIAAGTWNDSVPFGNPEDFLRNIEERGYYIYSIPVSEQNQAEREERIAPVVQIAVKLSGAFHSSNVIVNIQR